MSDLAVIISTSPRRQLHLKAALRALKNQSHQATEIVIVDDGSEGMTDIIKPFRSELNISYYHRPNDGNLSHSRNLGATYSKASTLVFMNGDILLNPNALKHYVHYLKLFPNATLWGYVGCRKKYKCPSYFQTEIQVNWLDFRFFPLSKDSYYIHPQLQSTPHQLASGHHFALTRDTFEHIGGFDETFLLWGEEDVEFALKGMLKDHPMHFVGDAWAEHIHHDYQENFHLQAPHQLRAKLKTIHEKEILLHLKACPPPLILFKYELETLWHLTKTHYLPYNPTALKEEQRHDHPQRPHP